MLDIRVHDLRDYTTDRHRVVDDVPFGGGPGMVLKPEPLFRAVDGDSRRARGTPRRGDADDAARAAVHAGRGGAAERRWSTSCCCAAATKAWTSGCAQALATEEMSIGDYVLSGGELPALVIVDAVARLVPGVVGDEQSVARIRSRAGCWIFRSSRGRRSSQGWTVPPVLLSGHHAEIERWRRREALSRTLDRRPDLLDDAQLDEDERRLLQRSVGATSEGVV